MIEPSLQLNPVDNLPPDTDPEPGVCLCVILQTGLFVKVGTGVQHACEDFCIELASYDLDLSGEVDSYRSIY